MPPIKNPPLTFVQLHEALDYNQETGLFTWKYMGNKNQICMGSIAGGADHLGYIQIKIRGRKYQAARLAWFYVHGEWPVNQIDHIDRNRANNALRNLRQATQAQNVLNRTVRANSLPLGVFKNWGKFSARITHNGKRIFLGNFDSPAKAHEVYRKASLQLHGEFSPLAEASLESGPM